MRRRELNPDEAAELAKKGQSSFTGAAAAPLNTSVGNHNPSRDYSSSQHRQQKASYQAAKNSSNPTVPPIQGGGLSKKSKSLECLGGTYYFRKNYLLPI